jgi:hypothetical protein
MDSPESIISKAWIHSHEEDSGDEMVFRPAAYPYPRSRGRTGYDLHPDGALGLTGPSPEDKQQSAAGRWEMPKHDELLLTIPGEDKRKFTITSLSDDKLVLKKAG